ncbi:MAG: 5-(carboxyamino)imidazole ribonucleotide synthase [Wenzhouxiangellaceae bacterium]|nr:5-(carboxyamino)imidazole ribonucleotide synthase [Wenzhouxiangellaceae bacterium]
MKIMKMGILGGGQLARMLAEAGGPLGLDFVIVDPKADACAAALGEFVRADYDDPGALARLAECERVTCDFENVPAAALAWLAGRVDVRPSAEALAASQDRLTEKDRFRRLGMDTPDYRQIDTRPDLAAAVEALGYPAVLKTRRFGYDGKGQAVLRGPEDLEPAWQELGGQPLIAERWVPFDHECAVTAVRTADGEVRFWPLTRTWHGDGILRLAGSPFAGSEQLQQPAEELIRRLADDLDYIGCLTLELFVADGRLLANEFAPRVHNSAHWTIEGAACSQFENHLRAVCGWPPGETAGRGASLMFNFIGRMPEARERWLAVPGLHWHDYDKQPRAGRKVGHATLCAPDRPELRERARALAPLLDSETARALASIASG